MISFNNTEEPEEYPDFSKDKYLELLKVILGADPFPPGSYHGGLSPQHLGELLGNIIYKQHYKTVHFIVEKEPDGYHLGLTIDKKEK